MDNKKLNCEFCKNRDKKTCFCEYLKGYVINQNLNKNCKGFEAIQIETSNDRTDINGN